jgi:hypothetical protein
MITIRRGTARGHADQDWLQTNFTFSFATYHDPAHAGFRALRVLNEDRIAPGRGFGAHAHRDMEILTYVLEGQIRHRDSMGQSHTFGANTIQMMSAGSGVIHSEFNASGSETLHLLQIWIEPAVMDAEPTYQQISFDPQERAGRFRVLAAPEGHGSRDAAVIRQDAFIYAASLGGGEKLDRALEPGRHGWIQIARGSASLNAQPLAQGDGAAVSDECELVFAAGPEGSEFLFFDLA